ncbi:MAG: LCP family protein [Clostridia bacterium]|nr:LCP family protein [Clostridia bacterium]
MKNEGFGAGRGALKKKNGTKVLMIVLIAVFTVIVVAVLGAWIYFKTAFNRMKLPDTVDSEIPPEAVTFETYEETDPYIDDTDEPGDTWDETDEPGDDTSVTGTHEEETVPHEGEVDPGKVEWPDSEGLGDDGLINILLVGQDTSSFKNRSRTDTMLLISVNPNTGGISMISFLRDLYVQIGNGYSDNRLNAAYPIGGFDRLFKVIKLNFGITCDYGVVVNFKSFMNIIDMLGGVEVELTQKEANYLKKTVPGVFPDVYPNESSVKVTAGKNLLPSEIALTYARTRKIDSDFGRTARQRKVMMSIYNRFRTADLGTILNIVNTVTGLSRPGEESWIGLYKITESTLIDLVTKLYPLIGNEITGYSVPAKGTYKYATIRGMSIILPDLVKIRENLKKWLPLDENHTIPSATTKKPVVPPATTKATDVTSALPEVTGSDEITSEPYITSDIGIVTDEPVVTSVTEIITDPPAPDTDPPDTSAAEQTEEINAPVSESQTQAAQVITE